MRKLFVLALLAGATLAGAAACDSDPATPSAPATTTSAGAAAGTGADTAAVCTEAQTVVTGWLTEMLTVIGELLQESAKPNPDPAKVSELEQRFTTMGQGWATKLSEWEAKDIDPALKTAIVEFRTTLEAEAANPDDKTGDAVQGRMTALFTALEKACA
jgi:hypothetical protein